MSVAQEYLSMFKITCVFHNDDDTVCGEPALAVYISADDQHEGRYVCEKHALLAQLNGDGPVFWPIPGLSSVNL
jgi:hypothetical protein